MTSLLKVARSIVLLWLCEQVMVDLQCTEYDCTGEDSLVAQHDFLSVTSSNADTTWSYVVKDMVKRYTTYEYKI